MQPNSTPALTEAETILGGALPHRRMEAWKWTDVRASLRQKQGLTNICTPEISVPEGIIVSRETIPAESTVMGAFAARFVTDCIVISTPENYKSDQPIRISGLGNGHARILIKLAKGAELSVVETHESDTASFINLDMQFDISEGAKLTRTIFHADHTDTTRIASSRINVQTDGEITQHMLSFGAGLSRFETRLTAQGKNVKVDIHGAYLLDEKRHVDMTSHIDLIDENAQIRQSVKGVITDKARGVFQGKFHVHRRAQFTDAEMRHDALMLSDTCEVRAKPELEIYADDVACAHGNTVGALDESALFYMRQRGIPASQARALLTQAFVAQAFESMADNTEFMTRISNWLEQRL